MSETFAYRAIEVRTPPRPTLDIVVRCHGRTMVARALVDSGADVSLMPLEWVQRLRFAQEHAVEQLVETASGAGTVATYDDVVRLTIARTRRSVNVGAVFADVPFMLLGRADFFRAFRVLFDERGRTVTLTEYDAVAA